MDNPLQALPSFRWYIAFVILRASLVVDSWGIQKLPDDLTLPFSPEDAIGQSETLAPSDATGTQPVAAPEVRSTPERIGPYRVIRLLGEGGMGAVYEAEQDQPRRRVALKVIKAAWASPELLKRFERESQALGRLHHAGIAQVYQAGSAQTGFGVQPFFAMELIDGKPLVDYADDHGLHAPQRLHLMIQVCEAVEHAHQRGIIHRDLKPGNILVDESGQPKILDFGLARATDSDAQATRQTDMGQLLGTLAYMSPEQVLADPLALDTRSDVYALGVILYELLAGKLPYTLSRHLHEAVRTIQETDPAPLSVVSRVYRGDIETIVAKALEKDKGRRYTSAAELGADLRRHLQDEPIVARPASTSYQLAKFAKRNRILVGGIAAVMLVLAAGATVSTILAIRATRAQALAEQRRMQTEQARAIAVEREKDAVTAQKLADQRRIEADAARSAEAKQRAAAVHSAQEAKKESQAAQQNFNMARDAVDNYFTKVSESPELKAHNLEKLRRQLLLTARDFYQKFSDEHADDKFLKADLGAAMLRVGSADLQMGETAQSEQSLIRSRTILEMAFKEHPGNRVIADNLFATYANLGLLYADTSQYDKAEQSSEQAIAFTKAWSAHHSLDGSELNQRADLYDSFGSLETRAGKLPKAIAAYGDALAIRRQLVNQYPKEDAYKTGLVMTDVNMVGTLAAMNEVAKALPSAEESVTMGEALYGTHPGDPDVQNRLAASYNNLGGLYTLLGRNGDAEKAHLHALKLREALAAEHPAIVEYGIRVASSYINLGELTERRNDPTAALSWLKKGENALLGVLASQPHQSTARYYLSYDYSWQARACDSQGDNKAAAQNWQRAIDYDDHNDPTLRVGKAMAMARLGDALGATALADKLVKGNPRTDALFELAGVYAVAAQDAKLAATDGSKSVALLNRVAAAGYFKVPEQLQQLKTSTQFTAIRARDDYKQMMAGIGRSK